MTKSNRIIFQPSTLADMLIRCYTSDTNGTMSDIVNAAIQQYYTPHNKRLAAEVQPIFYNIINGKDNTAEDLQSTLATCVETLKDYPVGDYSAIEQIMYHFRTSSGRALRYDYPLIVNVGDDEDLHRLNEVLKTVDSNYNMGCHELGERTRTIFANWDELGYYAETYTHIATIIRLENCYHELTTYRTICLIKMLDDAITDTAISKIADYYQDRVGLKERIGAKKYEILVYLADNAYAALTGDLNFNMPEDVREYYRDLQVTIQDSRDRDTAHFEEYYEDLVRLEEKGRRIFVSLARQYNG